MSAKNIALSVERDALDTALKRVSDTLSKRPIIPLTGFVRLVAEDGQLTLRTCDLDRQMTASIPADIDQSGAICLPGDAFRDIVSGFAAGSQVRLEYDAASQRCSIASGRSRYRLSTLPADGFPDIGAADGVTFQVPCAELKRAIGRVTFAVSTMEDRTFLWGAHLHIANDGGTRTLALVAMNGFVVSRCLMSLPDGLNDLPGVTIPTEALATLQRFLPDSGDVTLTISSERAGASINSVHFVTKLVEGRFPDYPRLIPKRSGRGATVDRTSLAAALGRFGVLDAKGSGISVTHTDTTLMLSGEHASLGDAREEVEAEIYANAGLPPFSCVVSRKYLNPIVSKLTGEHLLLDQEDASKIIHIFPLSQSDQGHDVLMMPMLAGVRQPEE